MSEATSSSVNLVISFDVLVEAITGLSLKDKNRLLEILDEQVAEAEEELFENSPVVQAKIHAARAAYEAGDYVTLEEHLAQQKGKE